MWMFGLVTLWIRIFCHFFYSGAGLCHLLTCWPPQPLLFICAAISIRVWTLHRSRLSSMSRVIHSPVPASRPLQPLYFAKMFFLQYIILTCLWCFVFFGFKNTNLMKLVLFPLICYPSVSHWFFFECISHL